MNNISKMRENYNRSTLDETHVDADAMKQFQIWFEEARKGDVVEPNAMIMSTINKNGHPTSRTLLLKGLEEDGFIFYTNYRSDKAKQMADNPNIALCFLWKKLQRQVRVLGEATKISKEQSEAYFQSRPKGSQIGAWVSPQSQVIANKEVIAERKAEYNEKFKDVEVVPKPDFWGGFKMIPNQIEFWQGRPDRLHDRLRYSRVEDNWIIERIAP